jgi:hypothetical protein
MHNTSIDTSTAHLKKNLLVFCQGAQAMSDPFPEQVKLLFTTDFKIDWQQAQDFEFSQSMFM